MPAAEYNRRRAECETAVGALARRFPHVRALRDVTRDQLEIAAGDLSDAVYRRCRHIVTENDRVGGAAPALAAGDYNSFGHLMRESHRSLRDDYEVSCAELDAMGEMHYTVRPPQARSAAGRAGRGTPMPPPAT